MSQIWSKRYFPTFKPILVDFFNYLSILLPINATIAINTRWEVYPSNGILKVGILFLKNTEKSQ